MMIIILVTWPRSSVFFQYLLRRQKQFLGKKLWAKIKCIPQKQNLRQKSKFCSKIKRLVKILNSVKK